jgi:hypothetical protein
VHTLEATTRGHLETADPAMTRLSSRADSASPAIISYRQMVQGGAQAMVGAGRSAVSMALAQLGNLDAMPQCSYWSSSPSLSDTNMYPYCAAILCTILCTTTYMHNIHACACTCACTCACCMCMLLSHI